MTEEEAKTKWCPMSRTPYVSGDGITGVNRDADGGIGKCDNCVGSSCMMWRWDQIRNPNWSPHTGMVHPAPHPMDSPALTIASNEHGHCGLAGRP